MNEKQTKPELRELSTSELAKISGGNEHPVNGVFAFGLQSRGVVIADIGGDAGGNEPPNTK